MRNISLIFLQYAFNYEMLMDIMEYLSIYLYTTYIWLYSACEPWPLFQFFNLHTFGRTPCTVDPPVARPLPTHRTT
jgi:hypothetical protein